MWRKHRCLVSFVGVILLSLGCWGCGGGSKPIKSPSALTYSANPAIYTKGETIQPNTPSHGGGAVDSYSTSHELPAGLSLNATTGVISGTPTTVTVQTTYVVTASNSGGSATTNLILTVNDIPPSSLNYTYASASFTVGTPILPDSPSHSGGTALSYTISPELPAGLSLNATTGVISGTPTTVTVQTTYVVTAANSAGSTTAALVFTVLPVVPPPGPVITSQPANATVVVGAVATFVVIANGTGTLTYQWQRNGTNIPGAVNSTYTTPLLAISDSGTTFRVLVSDMYGQSASNEATLTVISGTFTFTFTATGSLLQAHCFHSAALLPDGRVLVVSGFGAGDSELYAPASGLFSYPVSGLINVAASRTATVLPDGEVLVAGGINTANDVLAAAELFNPATGVFNSTGSMAIGRHNHTATLLPTGKVLMAGGYSGMGSPLANAQLYDPITGQFSDTGSMITARAQHTATLLANGLVLLTGGLDSSGGLAQSELYDPATGLFSTTGSLILGRFEHTATLLGNGMVLIVGGTASAGGAPIANVELYDPTSGRFNAAETLVSGRHGHTATLLPNGTVLIAGGAMDLLYRNFVQSELYNPVTGTFTATSNMITPRAGHTATLLVSGKVLITGGNGSTGRLALSELFQ